MSTQYAPVAARIVELIGGADNVRHMFHCQTRLRFDLRDESKVRRAELENTDGIAGVMTGAGQFQVIVGMHVKDVHDEIVKVLGKLDDNEPADAGAKASWGSRVIDFVSGSFTPIIAPIAGAGMIRALLALFSSFGWVDSTTQAHQILSFFADAVFYFLPVLLAFAVAQKLKANPFLAATTAAIMMHPTWNAMVAASNETGESLGFLGIPFQPVTYASTVVPILLIILVQSRLERFLNKVIHPSVRIMFVPMITFIVMGVVALAAIGPIGHWAGSGLNTVFSFLADNVPWLTPVLIGAFWPIMVMFGVHHAVGPIGFARLMENGSEGITGPGIVVSNIAQGVAALTVAFRTKDRKLRQIAASGGFTALMGISEPALYGVNLPKKYPLVAAMVGGAAGGFYAGVTGTVRFATGHSGLPALPMYLGDDTVRHLLNIIIALVIAAVVTAVLTFVLSLRFEKKPAVAPTPTGESEMLMVAGGVELSAPCSGTVIPLSEVQDKAFASGAMGPGVGVEPTDGAVHAPCSGEIIVAMDTGHAFGIRTDEGVEVLVHVGVNTVNMKGEGFFDPVPRGTRVVAGQRLVTADLAAIERAGHATTVIMVVTNHTPIGDLRLPQYGPVTVGETIASVGAGRD